MHRRRISRLPQALALGLILTASGLGCATGRPVAVTPIASWMPLRSDTRADRISLWNHWADAHLQNGDIVFMRGDCFILMGTVNFSELSADLTDSRFSHIGLAAIENGQCYVYDIRNQGCLRTRFGELLADRDLHQVSIKRHRLASAEATSRVVAFCRQVYERREKYDDQLRLDNNRLYCSELVELAYRSAGYELSEPVAIQDLPHFDKHQKAIQFVRAVTSIEPDQLVLLPGNDRLGIWSNPDLELVLDVPDTKTPRLQSIADQ